MTRRLTDAGRRLVAYDSRAEALSAACEIGIQPCGSAREVADRAPVVLMSLPTPDVVREAAIGGDGVIGGAAIRTCVDLSTTGPRVSRQIAGDLSVAGIEFVDAPVSGGVRGAENGTLTVMVACAERVLARLRPILEELAGNVFHVGDEAGLGQLAKVLNNLLSATALASTAEVMALGVKGGLDAATLLDVLNASSGRNSATEQKFPASVLPRTFDSGFALALMNKDVQMCLAEAEKARLTFPIGAAVARRWADATAWATADADCTEIVKLVEAEAGTVITADARLPD